MELLCVHNLTKTFAGCTEPVIRGVSFCVDAGKVFTLLGPSGCGKTTTLRTIMGFEHADAGEVVHTGRVLQDGRVWLPPEQRGIGFVFQDYALFPHLSVIQNVMFGIRGHPRRRRRQIAKEALWMVGLMGMEDRRPHDLSGGQQQRVALARAIAPGNRLILLDEPFSSLDPELRHATRNEVRLLAERGGIGIVLVTHDQEEALSTADTLAVMRDGRIIQQGPPEEVYDRPVTAFVAQFLGRTNLIRARAKGETATTPLGEIRLNQPTSGEVTLSVRPEHLCLHDPEDVRGGAPVGTVVGREFKGHDVTLRLRVGVTEYLVQCDYAARFHVGDKASLHARRPAVIVEAGDGDPRVAPDGRG
jgi:iron(III) transport system ATP-binding protein